MAMRARLIFSSVLAVLFAVAGGVHAQDWKRQTYATDGFEVEFSGPIDVHPQELDATTKSRLVRSTTYVQDGGNDYAYLVIAMLGKGEINFEGGVQAVRDSCKKITSDTALDVPNGRGRELHGTNCGDGGAWRLEGRYYNTGHWFYQAFTFVKMDGDDADNEAAHHFVRSFRLIGN